MSNIFKSTCCILYPHLAKWYIARWMQSAKHDRLVRTDQRDEDILWSIEVYISFILSFVLRYRLRSALHPAVRLTFAHTHFKYVEAISSTAKLTDKLRLRLCSHRSSVKAHCSGQRRLSFTGALLLWKKAGIKEQECILIIQGAG